MTATPTREDVVPVPREPTPEMVQAGADALPSNTNDREYWARQCWGAMLTGYAPFTPITVRAGTAAPAQPAPEVVTVFEEAREELAAGWEDLGKPPYEQGFVYCKGCDSAVEHAPGCLIYRMDRAIAALRMASPSAPERRPADAPPLRWCGYCHAWSSAPCGEQCGWQPTFPIFQPASPSAPSAPSADMQEGFIRGFKEGRASALSAPPAPDAGNVVAVVRALLVECGVGNLFMSDAWIAALNRALAEYDRTSQPGAQGGREP